MSRSATTTGNRVMPTERQQTRIVTRPGRRPIVAGQWLIAAPGLRAGSGCIDTLAQAMPPTAMAPRMANASRHHQRECRDVQAQGSQS